MVPASSGSTNVGSARPDGQKLHGAGIDMDIGIDMDMDNDIDMDS